jgi:hypothetical protein
VACVACDKRKQRNQRGTQQIVISEQDTNPMEIGMKSTGKSATNEDAHYESAETVESKQERMARKFGLGSEDIARGRCLSSQSTVPSTRCYSPYDRSARDYTPAQESPPKHTRVHSTKLWELTKDEENLALTVPLPVLLPRSMTERQGSLTSVKSSATTSSSLSRSLPSYIDACTDPNARSGNSGKPRRRNGAKDKTLAPQKFKVSWDKFPTDFPEASIKPTASTEHFLDGLDVFMSPTKKKTNILDLMRRDLNT